MFYLTTLTLANQQCTYKSVVRQSRLFWLTRCNLLLEKLQQLEAAMIIPVIFYPEHTIAITSAVSISLKKRKDIINCRPDPQVPHKIDFFRDSPSCRDILVSRRTSN